MGDHIVIVRFLGLVAKQQKNQPWECSPYLGELTQDNRQTINPAAAKSAGLHCNAGNAEGMVSGEQPG